MGLKDYIGYMNGIKTRDKKVEGDGDLFVSQGSSKRLSIFVGKKERAMNQQPVTSQSRRRQNFINQQVQAEGVLESQEFSTEDKPMNK